jgi:hypothetical protein
MRMSLVLNGNLTALESYLRFVYYEHEHSFGREKNLAAKSIISH